MPHARSSHASSSHASPSHASPSVSNNLKGVAFAVCGTALFTPIFAAAKFADGTIPVVVVIFIRYFSAFLLVLTIVLIKGISLSSLRSPKPSQHVMRAVFSMGSGGFSIYAATLMPLNEATAIGLTEGILVVALAALLLGERVTRFHWLAGLFCLAGAYLVLFSRLQNGLSFTEISGIAYAFLGAFSLALECLVLKTLARRESAFALILHVTGLCSLILAGPALYFLVKQDLSLWLLAPFFALGPIASLAQYCNIRAYRLAELSLLGPVNYSWIIFSALLGYLAFGEVPTLWAILGGTMIVMGGIWLTRLPTQPAKTPKGRLVKALNLH
ncbi:MAG: DMT family transporter [Cohaesibacter sp.]|nr:DMT family transporter [Cohaesibacter sp.]